MKITFPMALVLLFTGLKLTGYIGWSWWWITVPVWGLLVLAAVLGLIGAVIEACESPRHKAARLLRELANEMGRGR